MPMPIAPSTLPATFRGMSLDCADCAIHGMGSVPRTPPMVSRLLGRSQPAIDLVPVHHVPPYREIVRTAVLMLEVIRMFPNVIPHDRGVTFRDGIVLVRGAQD